MNKSQPIGKRMYSAMHGPVNGNRKIAFGSANPFRYNEQMLKTVLRKAVVVAYLAAMMPAPLWAAQRDRTPANNAPDFSVLEKPLAPGTSDPKPHAAAKTSCAEFGAGFAKLPGSDTCVRVGGSVRVDVGAAR